MITKRICGELFAHHLGFLALLGRIWKDNYKKTVSDIFSISIDLHTDKMIMPKRILSECFTVLISGRGKVPPITKCTSLIFEPASYDESNV